MNNSSRLHSSEPRAIALEVGDLPSGVSLRLSIKVSVTIGSTRPLLCSEDDGVGLGVTSTRPNGGSVRSAGRSMFAATEEWLGEEQDLNFGGASGSGRYGLAHGSPLGCESDLPPPYSACFPPTSPPSYSASNHLSSTYRRGAVIRVPSSCRGVNRAAAAGNYLQHSECRGLRRMQRDNFLSQQACEQGGGRSEINPSVRGLPDVDLSALCRLLGNQKL
ncbi:hypothetical protein [Candidatus Ichthyocystis hellenicum]|uniref:hypothetical protein n=1 Tax=Candidatus Ichthyocystis hellenicum TaxID=1561003 RepID=UPI000B893C5F|nr:hypothetical protein [Candidatus Ichthyocystis hellenicum]